MEKEGNLRDIMDILLLIFIEKVGCYFIYANNDNKSYLITFLIKCDS